MNNPERDDAIRLCVEQLGRLGEELDAAGSPAGAKICAGSIVVIAMLREELSLLEETEPMGAES